MKVITNDQAHAVWDILVNHAGAVDDADSRTEFVLHVVQESTREYRFVGSLGFGGKFRRASGDSMPRVDAYPEDMNPVRRTCIDVTNAAMSALFTPKPVVSITP